jgi:hypothetical protein
MLSHIVFKGSRFPNFMACVRSVKAQHSEWSNMDANQASGQRSFFNGEDPSDGADQRSLNNQGREVAQILVSEQRPEIKGQAKN